jgi:hypothetical protein
VTTLPIPVDRYLVPPDLPPLPDSFVRVRQSLDRALPAILRLDDELSLALYIPSGDGVFWRDSDGATEVLAAADETAANDAAVLTDPVARPPARLVLRRAGRNLGVAPLVMGLRRRLPDDGEDGALVEIWVRDFEIHAGTMRELGDFGSFIEFGWRRIDSGSARFDLPPLDPRVAERFAGAIQSQVGVPSGAEGQ